MLSDSCRTFYQEGTLSADNSMMNGAGSKEYCLFFVRSMLRTGIIKTHVIIT